MKANVYKILDDVIKERRRQDEKWGIQQHAPPMWLIILAEEMGEAAKALLENPANWRAELVQVAAVAVAAIEVWDEEVARGGHYCALSLNDNDHTIETVQCLAAYPLPLPTLLDNDDHTMETKEGE